MKIIVTGGAGFIGSHLVDKLIQTGHQVFVIDDLSTGSLDNLNHKAKFYKENLSNLENTNKILNDLKPEIIFHEAAQIDVRKSTEKPVIDAKINIIGSLNLIEQARKIGVKKIIFASSGGTVYREDSERPIKEIAKEKPISPYGIAKLTIDNYLYYFWKVFGLKYTSLRYANVYGPRQNYLGEAGVVAIFINKMLNGEQPVINGDGNQTRDYVFVNDIVQANLMALENPEKVGEFNLGTGKETSVNEIFNLINQLFNNQFKEKHGPAKLGEIKNSSLSYQKIKKEFGWEPKIILETGIKKTFKWFNDIRSKK